MPIKNRAGNKAAFTLVELAVVVCIFLVMIAALTPFVKMAKARSTRLTCAHNLRDISLGLHAYAAEHDEAFPAQLGELYPKYVASEKVFDCPATKPIGTADKPDYTYIAGFTESSPAQSVIVTDRAGNHGASGKNSVRINGTVGWSGK